MKRIVSVVVLLTLAGCGETTIDSGRLEEDIAEDAEREGLVLDDVECPSPEVEEGGRFDCTITVKGERRELEVEQGPDESVRYDLGPLLDFRAGSDGGGDEAAVRFVIDAINRDVTALCDYATDAYRRKLGGPRCARRAIARYDRPMRDYTVATSGDRATVTGGGRRVTLRRQPDGSWLITEMRAR